MAKPWLFVVLQPLFSYKGLTLEELREVTGLSMEVLKRGLWWLKKLGILEERNGKFYVKSEFYKHLEELLLSYCRVNGIHLLLIDNTYIVIRVKNPRSIYHWAIQKSLFNSLVEVEKFAGTRLSVGEISNTLGVSLGVATRLSKLRTLVEKCREHVSSAEQNHRDHSR